MEEYNDRFHDIKQVIILWFWIAFFCFVLPALGLYAFGGIDIREYFDKAVFYFAWAILWGIVITMSKVAEFINKSHKNFMPYLQSFVFDPEKAVLYKTTGFKWIEKKRNVIFISLIVFSILGLLSVATNTFFTELPPVEQQITETAKTILATEPASTAETLGDVAIAGIIFGLISYWLSRKGVGKEIGNFLKVLAVSLGTMFYHLVYHLVRYGDSQKSLIAVAMFGFVTGLLVVMFGNIFMPLIFHQLNNLFQKINTMFSNQAIFIVVIMIIALITIIYLTTVLRKKSSQQRALMFGGG